MDWTGDMVGDWTGEGLLGDWFRDLVGDWTGEGLLGDWFRDLVGDWTGEHLLGEWLGPGDLSKAPPSTYNTTEGYEQSAYVHNYI